MTRWLEDWYVEVLNGQITLPKIRFFFERKHHFSWSLGDLWFK